MKNAVIYARYSSAHQREESIEGQVRECKAFAERQGLNVIKVYADRAISGRTDNRPEFQQMIQDSSKKQFDNVIIYTFDRFSRDRGLSAIYKLRLKKNGVRVLSAKENIDNSPAGVLMESVLEGFSEYYSLELAQKVKRGMTDNILKGIWAGGHIPFGFELGPDKKLRKHPVNNAFLKKICEMYLNGANFVDLQNYLNDNGILTARGQKFNKDSFQRILSAPINYGFYRWGEYEFENYVEPTISYEAYQQIQKRLDARKHKGKVNVVKSEKYLLTPHFQCAECGGAMHGLSAVGGSGKIYYYYACANKRLHKTSCCTPNLDRDVLEDAIYNYACLILRDDESINAIAEQAMAANEADVDDELLALQARSKELSKSIENFMKAIAKGVISDALVERLNASEAELKDVKNKINYRKLISPSSIIKKEHVVFFLKHIAEITGEKAKEQVIRALVRNVAVQKQKDSDDKFIITVRFNYTDTGSLKASQDFLATVCENSQLVNRSRIVANKSALFFYKDGWQISFIYHKHFKRTSQKATY